MSAFGVFVDSSVMGISKKEKTRTGVNLAGLK
jgi:hypothetical protein